MTDDVRALARAAMGPLETKAGKPLHPKIVAAQREALRKPTPEAWRRAMSRRMTEVWEHPEEHGLPPCHRWTAEEVALLGTDHDSAIAERLGVPKHVVEGKRRRLGIAGILERWTDEEVALLGTRTDREVATRLVRTTAAVRRKREILGIQPFVPRWTEEEVALLGTDTDRNVAERLGRTRLAVMTKRLSLGIPASRQR